MACPLFIPHSPLGDLVTVPAPLGDLYGGQCAADPAAALDPETLRRHCNFGYARGQCARAVHSDADAVRLMVKGAQGSLVKIAWAVERNHHPVAVGIIEIEVGVSAAPAGEVLARQAYACASAYLRHSHSRPDFAGPIAAAAHP